MDKYQEALKRARTYYSEAKTKSFFSLAEMLEKIFPQLKESEDERIGKAIIHLIERRTQQFYEEDGISKEDMYAWLEKHKELFKDGVGMYYYDGEKVIFTGYQIAPIDNL